MLEKKRKEQEELERCERESFQKLMKETAVADEGAKAAEEERKKKEEKKKTEKEKEPDREKKLKLYRKGLIKDFHSSMAFSKMMQDIERSRQQKSCMDDNDEGDGEGSILETPCMKAMIRSLNLEPRNQEEEEDETESVLPEEKQPEPSKVKVPDLPEEQEHKPKRVSEK